MCCRCWRISRKVETTSNCDLKHKGNINIHRGKSACIELHSKLVHLRPLTVDEVGSAYHGWLCDPEVNKYLEVRFSVPTLLGLKDYVQSFDCENRFLFGIFSNDTSNFLHIGNFSITVNPHHQTASFGYIVGNKRYWGTRAATEAVVLFLSFVFEVRYLRKVWGGAYDTNVASIFNFHRFGFTREGVLRNHYMDGDEAVDGLIYGLLRDEWLKKRAEFVDIPVELYIP